MKKDKHIPKDSNGTLTISDDASKTLYGMMIVIISLIALLNRGIVGEALTYIGVYLFGVFYFIFYGLLLIIGVYLIIKKKIIKLKINTVLLGVVMTFLGCIIGTSLINNQLTITNCFKLYQNNINEISSRVFKIDSLMELGNTGGGIFGYFLTGLLNSCISNLGTEIVTIILISLGLVLMFKDIFIKLLNFFKNINERKKNKKRENELVTYPETITKPEEETKTIIPEENSIIPIKEEIKVDSNVEDKDSNISSPFKTNSAFDYRRTNSFIDKEEVVEEKKESFNSISNIVSDEIVEKTPELHFEEVTIKKEEPVNRYQDIELFNPNKVKSTNFNNNYIFPSISLLDDTDNSEFNKIEANQSAAIEISKRINRVFNEFNIKASVINYKIGPSVTRYDVKTEAGVRVSSIASINEEICVKLDGNKSVRIETVVQGKDTSGIEVGNKYQMKVTFKEVFGPILSGAKDKLTIPLGKTIDGEVKTISLDALPHLLIAGTTGSGKSIFVHSIIMTLIMRNNPDELKLMMIDPKKVEFVKYQEIPHLLCPIINDKDEAKIALVRLVDEMERRYSLLANSKVSNLKEYDNLNNGSHEKLPNIVVIIDEYADLVSSSNSKELELLIQRLAQKARACGIYLIVCTQRPTATIITGDIKANIPARIALSVSSSIDSRVILDEVGAERLVGKGDLLVKVPSIKSMIRLQSAFVSNEEILKVTDYLRNEATVSYDEKFLNLEEEKDTNEAYNQFGFKRRIEKDPMYDEVKAYVLQSGIASSSGLRRMFGIGYSRSAAILDMLEDEGVIKTVSNNGRKEVVNKPHDEFND